MVPAAPRLSYQHKHRPQPLASASTDPWQLSRPSYPSSPRLSRRERLVLFSIRLNKHSTRPRSHLPFPTAQSVFINHLKPGLLWNHFPTATRDRTRSRQPSLRDTNQGEEGSKEEGDHQLGSKPGQARRKDWPSSIVLDVCLGVFPGNLRGSLGPGPVSPSATRLASVSVNEKHSATRPFVRPLAFPHPFLSTFLPLATTSMLGHRSYPPATPPPAFYYDTAAIASSDIQDYIGLSSPHHCPSLVDRSTMAGSAYLAPLSYRRQEPLLTPSPIMTDHKVDMGMAQTGSMAAAAGYQTPLANYAAQMVVWLWYGTHHPPAPQSPSPLSTNSSPSLSNPFTTSPPAPINILQVQPSPVFSDFVARMLQVTMVSHSVTLVALLYIHRLKSRNRNLLGGPGSEQKIFVASLILGNKYLDDNTYTNATWSELASMPLKDINAMESEFLSGINYDLGVEPSEYRHWRQLLDGFIYSKEQDARRSRIPVGWAPPPLQPQNQWHSPQSVSIYTPELSTYGYTHRARSASPLPYVPSPPRKRSAVDAFSSDGHPSSVYEMLRLPTRKVNFQTDLQSYQVQPSQPAGSSQGYSIGRASSLNRQIARLPGALGRRGSAGQLHGLGFDHPVHDLRHVATQHAQQQQQPGYWNGYKTLSAPFDRIAQPQSIPPPDVSRAIGALREFSTDQLRPQHLMFYSLAAEPHPGQDGAPRKAILRYQEPSYPYVYPYPPNEYAPQQLPPNVYDDSPEVNHYPAHIHPYNLVPARPAMFANAGPPGYAYYPVQGWSSAPEDHQSSRTEWSSPNH
ncbi:hypothetical protein P7C73_g2812, partial [Tremellales sp. Uapishka_1]